MSVLLPLAAAGWKRHSIWRKFSILVILLIVGGLNDLTNFLMIKVYGSNTVIANVYQLVEFTLFIWLFKRWPSTRKSHFHLVILIIGVLLWILDNCVLHSLSDYNSIFRAAGAILLVLVSVDQINHILLNRENSIIVSEMLVCTGFVLYYLYKAFVESFELFPLHVQCDYYVKLWIVECLINLLTNVMITIAFLCHRSKPTFTILS